MHVSCWSPCARLWRIAFASNMSHWDHACLESLCKLVENCSLELGGGGLGEKLEMANSIYCCCDCCMHCTHVSCKKVLFGAGGLGGKCIDKLNSLLLCVCETSIAFKQPPTKPKCEDPIRASMGQPFKQPPTKPKFEDPIRAGMGQPLSVSLKNNVRCSPNPSCSFFLRSVSSQLHIHACVMLESLCKVVENCLCKQYVPLGP